MVLVPTIAEIVAMAEVLARNLTVNQATYLGHPAVKVAFTEAYQKHNTAGATGQAKACVSIPLAQLFYEGIIDVDCC